MSEKDCGALMHRGIDHDRPERKFDAARVAMMAREVETAGLIVEVYYPETLVRGITFGEAVREELPGTG